MLNPVYTNAFKKDIKLVKKRHLDTAVLKTVMTDLIEQKSVGTQAQEPQTHWQLERPLGVPPCPRLASDLQAGGGGRDLRADGQPRRFVLTGHRTRSVKPQVCAPRLPSPPQNAQVPIT